MRERRNMPPAKSLKSKSPLVPPNEDGIESATARHIISNAIDLRSVEYLKNEQRLTARVAAVETDAAKIREMGGKANVEKQYKKGRMTARERIAALIDSGDAFWELGLFAAWGMYTEWGGAPAAGVITGV